MPDCYNIARLFRLRRVRAPPLTCRKHCERAQLMVRHRKPLSRLAALLAFSIPFGSALADERLIPLGVDCGYSNAYTEWYITNTVLNLGTGESWLCHFTFLTKDWSVKSSQCKRNRFSGYKPGPGTAAASRDYQPSNASSPPSYVYTTLDPAGVTACAVYRFNSDQSTACAHAKLD